MRSDDVDSNLTTMMSHYTQFPHTHDSFTR